jgi:hypothetical protein
LADIPLFFDTGQNQQGIPTPAFLALCQMCGMGRTHYWYIIVVGQWRPFRILN